ncbi:chymotrypsin-like elastase family member 2A [Neocloeon triangulifer]|uniref:chymotrypsin-like elastase family member 2A n=1 Tax=Neocloeon triangulifer TaxID=2078957 RepID=UPI00286EFCE6|nr:chymotrypsin-like elastase family member 2A [Neocloeon triangulifer]
MKGFLGLACTILTAHGFAVNPLLDGGPIANAGQFPWHVHVQPVANVGANFSGILINPSWVLTCAACINKSPDHTLIFGARNLDLNTEPGRIVKSVAAENVFIFPDYNPGQFNERNIALVQLNEPIPSSPYVDTIGLPDETTVYDNYLGRISGFGFAASNDTSGTQLLRYTDLEILPDTECRNLKEGQMCALVGAEGIGPCRDEGSALYIVDSEGTARVVGVFSYGYNEGSCPGTKPLFTRVSLYLSWIDSVINGGTGEITTPAADEADYEY